MYKAWAKKYGGWFVLGILLIACYMMFDEFILITQWFVGIIEILSPFLIGGVLSYFLYIPSSLIERYFLKKDNPKLKKHARSLGIFFTYVIFLLFVAGILIYLIPVIRDNLIELADRLPIYDHQLSKIFGEISKDLNIPNIYETLSDKIVSSLSALLNIDPWEILSQGVGIVSTLLSWVMAIVICPYLLLERDNLLKIFDLVVGLRINQRDLRLIHRYAKRINQIFSDFIWGKALDSLIIGVIAYVVFHLMNLRFDLLLALVILITNMIPYFGPFIGGIPVTIFVFISMGIGPACWTGLVIFALQQFDGLLLGPFILGDAVGVSALWIIFAITFFGGTLGFVGMVIGVPLIAVIRMLFSDYVRYRDLKRVFHQTLETQKNEEA